MAQATSATCQTTWPRNPLTQKGYEFLWFGPCPVGEPQSSVQSFAILECRFAVIFHFFDQLVSGWFFLGQVVVWTKNKTRPMDINIYIFITNKFVAVTNASMQINF